MLKNSKARPLSGQLVRSVDKHRRARKQKKTQHGSQNPINPLTYIETQNKPIASVSQRKSGYRVTDWFSLLGLTISFVNFGVHWMIRIFRDYSGLAVPKVLSLK